jgi:hypothetical protein
VKKIHRSGGRGRWYTQSHGWPSLCWRDETYKQFVECTDHYA